MADATGTIRVRWRLPTGADARAASEAAIRKAAIKAVSLILRRTAQGIDARGAPFKPYSARYAAKKAASGRKGSPPDLTLTGTLLRGLRLLRVETVRRAIIGWEGQHVARNPLAGFSVSTAQKLFGVGRGPLSRKQSGVLARASKQARTALHTVAYAVLVPALNRRRRFFAIESAADKAAVRKVYVDTLAAEMRRRLQGR